MRFAKKSAEHNLSDAAVLPAGGVVLVSDELFYLYLAGLGVRALTPRTGGGFFVLAGPSMDVRTSYLLFHWDGQSSVFEGEPGPGLSGLGEVAHASEAAPEGLFLYDVEGQLRCARSTTGLRTARPAVGPPPGSS